MLYAEWTDTKGDTIELWNVDRAKAYIQAGLGPKANITAHGCGVTQWLPDVDEYTSPAGDQAWWYSDDTPRLAACTATTAGFIPTRVDGLDASTTSRRTYDLVGDGAALGRLRRNQRLITVTGIIVAETCCGASTFQRALTAKLEARGGGCTTDVCGGGELKFLECPPCNDLDNGCRPSTYEPAQWMTLCNVGLTSSVRNTGRFDSFNVTCGSCRAGHIREITFSMVAGDPSLWWSYPDLVLTEGTFDVDNNYCALEDLFHCCPTIFVKQRQARTACPVRVNRDGTLCPLGWTPDANGEIPEDCYIVATSYEEVEADPIQEAADAVCDTRCVVNLVYNRISGVAEWVPIGDGWTPETLLDLWDEDKETFCGCEIVVGKLTYLADDPDEEPPPFGFIETQNVGDYSACCRIRILPPADPTDPDANGTFEFIDWDPALGFPPECEFVIENVCPPEEEPGGFSTPCPPETVCKIEPYVNSAGELVYEPIDFEIEPTAAFPPEGCIGFEAVKQDRKDRTVLVEVPDPDCGCGFSQRCLVKPDCEGPTAPQRPVAADPCEPCQPVCATYLCETVPAAPGCTEGVIDINITAGSKPFQNVFVRVFENPQGFTTPEQFSECDACGDFAIAGIVKRTTFMHDGKTRKNRVLCKDGVTTLDASRVVSSSGNQWPVVTDTPLMVCVYADATATGTKLAKVDINVHWREN